MTLKTKLFGKKVQGKALYKLVNSIGEDWERIALNKNEKYSISDLYGKCNCTPKQEGINVDLYVFRTDIHECDGTSDEDYVSGKVGEGPRTNQREIKYKSVKHLEGEMSYKNQ